MILLILAAQAAAPAPTTAEPSRFAQCAALAADAPDRAIEQANQWQMLGGGAEARQCIGLAYAAQERWIPAATAFEQAARQAEISQQTSPAALWVQAGNARLAGGEAQAARAAFNAALARGELTGAPLGEAHLDRARATVALGELAGARGDIDKALALVPEDPLAWLLSATLARRQNDLARAQQDIDEAARRSPDDASVALEAGNIAILAGAPAAARAAWQGAILNQPGSAAAVTAAAQLKQLDAESATPEG
ncbi:hypothetical protein ACMT1E_14555 [Sphingomonas flavalba]|uniref:hypothetical protein n=1 Tax=Sphingomonas flavalba TaxID=2559804 RepID=UPI0039E1F938